jgi:hypothetical protein
MFMCQETSLVGEGPKKAGYKKRYSYSAQHLSTMEKDKVLRVSVIVNSYYQRLFVRTVIS